VTSVGVRPWRRVGAAPLGLGALALALAVLPLPVLLALLTAILIALVPVVGLIGAAVGVPFGGLLPLPLGVGALTITPVLLAWTAYVVLLGMLARRRLPALSVPLLAPLAAALVAQAVSAWRAPDLPRAAFEMGRWVELALVLVLVIALVTERRWQVALTATLLVAGAFEAIVGLRGAGGGPAAFAVLGSGALRAYGTFGQPNPFGGYLNMVWPLGLALFLRFGVRPLGLVGLVAGGICGVGMVASWSRGAWLGALAAAVAMGVMWGLGQLRPPVRFRTAGVAWLVLVGALAVLTVGPAARLPAGVAARVGSIGETFAVWGVADAEVDDANFATIERVAHWEAAVAMWAEHPWLGQGPGQYEVTYDRFRLPRWADALGHAHNYYLHVLAEGGLIGLLSYLWFLAAAVLLALRAALRPVSSLHGALGLGLIGVLAALACHSMVDNLFVHEMAVHLGLLLGLTVVAGRSS